jgi:hypothetical protein
VGTWDQTEEFRLDNCWTVRLTISVRAPAQKPTNTFRADQRVSCSNPDGGDYLLHYDGELLQNHTRYFISLNPVAASGNVKPVEPVEGTSVVTYTPDRLTLWLSRGGCTLIGSFDAFDDSRGANINFGLLTLTNHACEAVRERNGVKVR